MALKKVKGSIDRIFDKNLQDLVRGIRNHKDDETQFINSCIDEIKLELKQENVSGKANAVKKLIYLQMLGYDVSWAAFNIIEVMSSAKFTHKRIGYMVASQSFRSDTDVLMLATNLIKKDLLSQNVFDVGVALSGLSCFITPDLARDLCNDILTLMSSSKPYARKRAVLISYKIFLNYPEALRPAFPRLKEKLEDPDPGVQSAAVNVVCELARKNPKNYLSLAPVFFKLMTQSNTTNNWVLIKVIKLFGALTPLEPRLGKKLIEPLTNLIHNTSAMSLLYECINTVIQGMQDHSASIQGYNVILKLCVQKLRILIEDSDQNLKYLGLLALSRILKSHPKAVQAHKDLILQCLDDKDESIRLRALDLLFGMVSKKNLMEIIQKLLAQVQKAETIQYRDELISKIVEICSRNNFHFITNFEWYITVLLELTVIDGTSRHGKLVSAQILDVAIRVKTIRPFAANKCATILQKSHVLSPILRRNGMIEVFYAAAYICGEFAENITDLQPVLMSMLDQHVIYHPTHIQHIFVQNMTKMFGVLLIKVEAETGCEGALAFTKQVQEKLSPFLHSSNLEVQERASCTSALLRQIEKMLSKSTPAAALFASLFRGELNPVAPKAQKRVPLPEGLDLDSWINDPPSSSESEAEEDSQTDFQHNTNEAFYPSNESVKKRPELTEEQKYERREARKTEMANNPNYLGGGGSVKGYQKPDNEVEEIGGGGETDMSVPLHVPGLSNSEQYMKLEQQRRRRAAKTAEKAQKQTKKTKGKKGGKKQKRVAAVVEVEEEIVPTHKVEIVDYEMPEGALKLDSDDERDTNDIYKALDMDLEAPMSFGESVPVKKPTATKKTKKNAATADTLAVETVKTSKKKTKKSSKKSKVSADETVVNGKRSKSKNNNNHDALAAVATQMEEVEEKLAELIVEEVPEKKVKEMDEEIKSKKTKKSKSKKGDKKEKKTKKSRSKKSVAETVDDGQKEVETVVVEQHNYKLLAEDQMIRVEYETRTSFSERNKISLFCIFTNLSAEVLDTVAFNLTDTLNTKLVRVGINASGGGGACTLPFSLYPQSSNEACFELTATSVVMPQRLRGTIQCGGSGKPLDFKLYLPCSSYLVSTQCSSDAFAKLLASNQLTEKSSVRIMSSKSDFGETLQLLTKIGFQIVEQIGENASLYSKSIQDHDLCLLIKNMTKGLSIEGKSSNQSILSNVLDETKLLLQP